MSHRILYQLINVVRRNGANEIIIYRCLKCLPSGGFVVQSADFVQYPPDPSILAEHDRQFWELFLEEDPISRSTVHPTIEEAIASFDEEFAADTE